jgi:hypothetical protein
MFTIAEIIKWVYICTVTLQNPTPTSDTFVGGRSQGLTHDNFRSLRAPIPQRAGHADGLATGHARYGITNAAKAAQEEKAKGKVENPYGASRMKAEGEKESK